MYHHDVRLQDRGVKKDNWKEANYFMSVKEGNKIKISKFKLGFVHKPRSIIHHIIDALKLPNLLRF